MALETSDLVHVQDAADKAARDAIGLAIGNFGACLLSAGMETIPIFLQKFIACITGAGTCKPK